MFASKRNVCQQAHEHVLIQAGIVLIMMTAFCSYEDLEAIYPDHFNFFIIWISK